MKNLLLLVLLFAACAPSPKVYTEVEIGMSSVDFHRICPGVTDDSQSTTNTSGSTKTLINRPSDFNGNPRPYPCVGKFTFVNGKLESISR